MGYSDPNYFSRIFKKVHGLRQQNIGQACKQEEQMKRSLGKMLLLFLICVLLMSGCGTEVQEEDVI